MKPPQFYYNQKKKKKADEEIDRIDMLYLWLLLLSNFLYTKTLNFFYCFLFILILCIINLSCIYKTGREDDGL